MPTCSLACECGMRTGAKIGVGMARQRGVECDRREVQIVLDPYEMPRHSMHAHALVACPNGQPPKELAHTKIVIGTMRLDPGGNCPGQAIQEQGLDVTLKAPIWSGAWFCLAENNIVLHMF